MFCGIMAVPIQGERFSKGEGDGHLWVDIGSRRALY